MFVPWRNQDERKRNAKPRTWPCSLEAAGMGVGVRVGVDPARVTASGRSQACTHAAFPTSLPQVDVWNLPPVRRGGQCCSPQPGQGVGTGLQLPTGQTCRTCRTLLLSVGLTGPQQQQEQSHGWHLPHGLGLAGVPAGQGTAVAGVASARARRSGLHEVGYMLQMSVSSAMLLDLSAWPAQFLSTGRRHPRTLVPP